METVCKKLYKFQLVDANQDRILSRKEFDAAWSQETTPEKLLIKFLAYLLDYNDDGFISNDGICYFEIFAMPASSWQID